MAKQNCDNCGRFRRKVPVIRACRDYQKVHMWRYVCTFCNEEGRSPNTVSHHQLSTQSYYKIGPSTPSRTTRPVDAPESLGKRKMDVKAEEIWET